MGGSPSCYLDGELHGALFLSWWGKTFDKQI